jgi:hypothetical protein
MTQSSIQSPVTIQELLVSSLAQTDALAKLLIEKGLDHPRRVYAEDFKGAGDLSEATEPDTVMNIGEILIWESRREHKMLPSLMAL